MHPKQWRSPKARSRIPSRSKAYRSGSVIGFPTQAYTLHRARTFILYRVSQAHTFKHYFNSPLLSSQHCNWSCWASVTMIEEYNTVAASTTGLLLHTSSASEIGPSIAVPILVFMVAFYLSLWFHSHELITGTRPLEVVLYMDVLDRPSITQSLWTWLFKSTLDWNMRSEKTDRAAF
jgi:hypothetical protein